ncbi:unnamed protein product [Gongylonema pulchrum]|uniref:Secreted protein n=1 Tax=Gongylonema pulchrum TaxID=637853 RepID=A0A183DGD2_9BILA|nr:unnamed protein product [Gongylonema pulchrum]
MSLSRNVVAGLPVKCRLSQHRNRLLRAVVVVGFVVAAVVQVREKSDYIYKWWSISLLKPVTASSAHRFFVGLFDVVDIKYSMPLY